MNDPMPNSQAHSDRSRSSRMLVVLAVAVVVIGTAWQVVRVQRGASQQQLCKTRLKQLGLALHEYHAQHGMFPPAYTLGPDGKRWHSWRVLLLPFLGEQRLLAEYHFDEPWDGPRNRLLALRMPAAFECPAGDGVGRGIANYLAIVGRRSAWPEHLSVSVRDFKDGTSNTLSLVESADSNINWLEPRDITVKQLLEWDQADSAPSCCSRHPGEPNRHMLLADGAVRRVPNSLQTQILSALITPSSTGTPASALLPLDGGETPEAVFPERRDVRQTNVVPVASAAIVKGRNSLYCCTLRMAWDELRQPPDNQAHVPQPPSIVDELNKVPFPKGCLAPENSLVQIESLADVGKIHAEMARRFPGAKGPRTPPSNQPGFVVFAYLRKSLPFAVRFDVHDRPLNFPRGGDERPVASFGRLGGSSSSSYELLPQVQVRAYDSEDDFVIELRSTAQNDTLLLAKIPPQGTLQETIDAAMKRSRKAKPHKHRSQLEGHEDLIIPKLSLNVLHEFNEFHGLRLPDFDARFGGAAATIQDVIQGIAFVLNERGAEVESFAELGVVGSDGDDTEPTPRRRFVFDRPFLVLLSERDAAEPYFALWIENTELMEIAR